MALDDGHFLVSADRYDHLLRNGHSEDELSALRLLRVDPNFRVIALVLPVRVPGAPIEAVISLSQAPKFQGNPLDPPLRSRFQARFISELDVSEHVALLDYITNDALCRTKLRDLVLFSQLLTASSENPEGEFIIPSLILLTSFEGCFPISAPRRRSCRCAVLRRSCGCFTVSHTSVSRGGCLDGIHGSS